MNSSNSLPVILGHKVEHMVAFVGPFGVGKTTALRALSDIEVVTTEAMSTESLPTLAAGKTTTTVGLDYGEWLMPKGQKVSLVGVPGQERFNAMWDALLPRSSAIVLWLYADDEKNMRECRKWLDIIATRQAVSRLSVALTRLPSTYSDKDIDPWRALVREYHPFAPVLVADPRIKNEVIGAVVMALASPMAAIVRT